MAKISPISGKYIIHASIQIDGMVDRPDIIGAIFGQTEGLLGSQLELRELQRSGRIGRIEVNTESKMGKTKGEIIIPSSLDKAETVIVAAAIEIIERIGPCNSKILITSVEDVRVSKRNQVVERAKELLKMMTDNVLPDSQELAEQVAESVRVMEIGVYGRDKLPCGPGIDESEEIIVVEGRADVLNMLKNGFKNVIAMNGSNMPETLIELCKEKTVTVFVDGDRGGLLNVKELLSVTEIDFVARAPDGKEVEEITLKEIHKALRGRVTPEQMKSELQSRDSLRQPMRMPSDDSRQRPQQQQAPPQRSEENHSSDDRSEGGRDQRQQRGRNNNGPAPSTEFRSPKASNEELESFAKVLDDLVGSHAAALLDEKLGILGKVPMTELESTVESLENTVYAVVIDGSVDKNAARAAEKAHVKFIVGKDTKIRQSETRVSIVVIE